MSNRINPLPRETKPECETAFQTFEKRMGFVPNSVLTMQRKPMLVNALMALSNSVYADPEALLPNSLKACMAQIASTATGCLYCQAHFGGIAELMDTPVEKVEALWEYQTSPLFSEAERAAFDFAVAAVQIPNAVTDEDFQRLRQFYSEDEIVELMTPLMHTAFLNRWNDTMGTPIEEFAVSFGEKHLQNAKWEAGKHSSL